MKPAVSLEAVGFCFRKSRLPEAGEERHAEAQSRTLLPIDFSASRIYNVYIITRYPIVFRPDGDRVAEKAGGAAFAYNEIHFFLWD